MTTILASAAPRGSALGISPMNSLIRACDVLASGMGLVLLSPVFFFAAAAIRLDSAGPVFFRQERVGRDFRRFHILKFRTMVAEAPARGGQLTVGHDARITRVGRLLRKYKIDELPQLVNVLKGEMSLVGPRPEVPRYVEMFRRDYADILRIPPGITDPASLVFRSEAELLEDSEDPERAYVEQILPRKIRLAREYVEHRSLLTYFSLIFRTLLALVIAPASANESPCLVETGCHVEEEQEDVPSS